MEIKAKLLKGKVMHERFFPKKNKFSYSIYYISIPISKLDSPDLKRNLNINRFGLLSFFTKDHGDRKSDLQKWIRNILAKNNLDKTTKEIILICMPRILGYVFNPVSFWLCLDNQSNLKAVLCEVNNTFGETHSYLCVKKNKSIIKHNDILIAKKLFHVSPFLKREGFYKFRFTYNKQKFGAWIDYYNAEKKLQLCTYLIGYFHPLTKRILNIIFFTYPLVTLKTIFLIHWQALKLFWKGVKYIKKPLQKKNKITKTDL